MLALSKKDGEKLTRGKLYRGFPLQVALIGT